MRALDGGDRARDGLLVGDRAPVVAGGNRLGLGALACDVLGELEVHRARTLLLREPKCLPDARRDRVRRHDGARVLRERTHHVDDVDDLEVPLLARSDRLLARDHEHRHPAELRVRRGGHEVGRPRPQRRETDARSPRQAAPGRGHEAGGLLVARDDQSDARRAQRLEEIEVLLARETEDVGHALRREGLHEKVRSFRHSGNVGPLRFERPPRARCVCGGASRRRARDSNPWYPCGYT